MKATFLNTAPMLTAAGPRLLTPPSIRPEVMRAEIAYAFKSAGVSQAGMEAEIFSTVQELALHSTEWNTLYYDEILYNHVRHFKDVHRVHERLWTELDFFRRLYKPTESFNIHPVDNYDFGYEEVIPTVLFESGGIVYGRVDFLSWPEAIILDYIQSATHSTSREQIKAFGSRWFEAFMDRAIESFARLNDMGVRMLLKIKVFKTNDEADFSPLYYLPRMVRDRYFEPKPDKSGELYALSFKKQRVQRILKG